MSGPNDTGSDEITKAMTHAVERIENLAVSIRDEQVAEEHIWYKHLLLGILNSALLDYRYVERGVQNKSAYLSAWSCRNLLELNVISAYVLESAENATDFKYDFAVDAKEFYEAISKRQKVNHKKLISMWKEANEDFEEPMKGAMEAALQREIQAGPQTQTVDDEAKAFEQVMVSFGIDPKTKPKMSSQIAKLVSRSEEFQPMFKLCSKVMHRTAFSIASSVIKGSLDEAIPLFGSTAFMELLEIGERIGDHYKQKGVTPPTDWPGPIAD
jgi:hypothetical protein